MEYIPLPTDITVTPDPQEQNRAILTIEPCHPGFATTLGNALRRVLLSSLRGSAVTAINIRGAQHEFSTIDNVKEDVVAIILNCKQLKFKVGTDEPVVLHIKAKGKKVVTGKDIEKNSMAVSTNDDAVICTLTSASAVFEADLTVEKGMGYIPVENRDHKKNPIGTIAIDAVYTPLRNVNFDTEHVRMGQMTDFERLILTIETDGTISPTEAFQISSQILTDHFNFFLGDLSTKHKKIETETEPESTTDGTKEPETTPLSDDASTGIAAAEPIDVPAPEAETKENEQ